MTGERGEGRTKKKHLTCKQGVILVAGVMGQRISGQLWGLRHLWIRGGQIRVLEGRRRAGFSIPPGRNRFLFHPCRSTRLWSGIPPKGYQLRGRLCPLGRTETRVARRPFRERTDRSEVVLQNGGTGEAALFETQKKAEKSPEESGFILRRAGSCTCRGSPFPM